MKIDIREPVSKFPKLFTDYKNRLFVFEKENDDFLYFRVYQFWDKSEFHDSFKITLEELMKHFRYDALPFERFGGFSGQDRIAYNYMLDKIVQYL